MRKIVTLLLTVTVLSAAGLFYGAAFAAETKEVTCPDCGGSENAACSTCGGTGRITAEIPETEPWEIHKTEPEEIHETEPEEMPETEPEQTHETESDASPAAGQSSRKQISKKQPAVKSIDEMTVGRIHGYTFVRLLGENGKSCGRMVMTNTVDGLCVTLSMEDPNDPRIQDAYFLLYPVGATEGEKHLFGETVVTEEGTRIVPAVGGIDEFMNAEGNKLFIR